jgi:hypothetical protein
MTSYTLFGKSIGVTISNLIMCNCGPCSKPTPKNCLTICNAFYDDSEHS